MTDMSKMYGEGKPPIPAIEQPTVMFMINHSLAGHPWTEVNIYRATQCSWVIGPRPREQAVYALGVSHGVVRGAYLIEGWRNVEGNRGNWWCFDGRSASELDNVVGTSIERIKASQGTSSPVRLFLTGIPASTPDDQRL